MRIVAAMIIVTALVACKARQDGSAVKDQPAPGNGEVDQPGEDNGNEVQGLWRENRPVVTTLNVPDGAEPIADDWTAPSGHEYWLYSQYGSTGMMAGGYGGTYRPYGGGTDRERCLAGEDRYCRRVCGEPSQDYERQVSNPEWCEKKPSELARRCMYQAGLTLKAILDNPPEEYTDWLTRNRQPSFYGWIDDGGVYGFSGRMSTGPFKWRTYMKWAGSVKPDGTCTTGSLGQFLKWLQQYDGHEDFRRN